MTVRNMFDVSRVLSSDHEAFERLATGGETTIERIVSSGQKTPEGEWYDGKTDEWVMLIQGEAILSFEDTMRQGLKPGDSIFLPAHVRHRVEYTSADPPCIWIAVHATMQAC